MRLKTRTNVRKLFILGLLLWSYPTVTSLVIGGVLIILGQTLHFISSGYLVKQEQLITAGPYRFVRNPFYLANFLLDAGLCIITLNVYVTTVYLPLFYLVIIHWRIRKEEKFLGERFGAAYAEYCRAVPRFFPRIIPASIQPNGQFSWEQITRHLEQWRFLRVMSLIIFFYLRVITMDILPQVWQFRKIPNIYPVLIQPLNLALIILLLLILFIPPLWVFVIKRRHGYAG